MTNKKRLLILCYIMSLLLPAYAQAARVEFGGHTYELIIEPDVSWDDAKAAAEASLIRGVPGHLATSTSAAENDFLFSLVIQSLGAWDGAAKTQAWIGGSQVTLFSDAAWEWVDNEGTFPPTQSPANPYSNWAASEPNSLGEHYLTLGRYAGGLWNDSSNIFIGGYLIEWNIPLDPEACKAPEVCNPSGLQEVQLPVNLQVPPGATLTQTVVPAVPGQQVEFTDTRIAAGTCGQEPLELLGGALVIPKYLCGSPDIIVIESTASFNVPFDVVRSEQFPENFFDANSRYSCPGDENETGDPGQDPIFADLQRRGVFVWQPDDRTDVIEQHALELTNGCGSSRGATKGLSYFVLNMHIDCGIPFGTDDTAVLQCFTDLTTDKFDVLDIALANAKSSLINPNYGALRSTFEKARNRFKQEKYAKAIGELDILINLIQGAMFEDFMFSGNNHQGELLMRAENIMFMIDEKIDP